MIHALRTMVECRWSARRIQRYIDADPAAPLTAGEVRRLTAHLDVCERCTTNVRENRRVKASLARLSGRRAPDPVRVARVRLQAQRLSQGEGLS